MAARRAAAPSTGKRPKMDLDDHRTRRIVAIASEMVAEMMSLGQIPRTMKAVREVMPQAIADATTAYDAAIEYIS